MIVMQPMFASLSTRTTAHLEIVPFITSSAQRHCYTCLTQDSAILASPILPSRAEPILPSLAYPGMAYLAYPALA